MLTHIQPHMRNTQHMVGEPNDTDSRGALAHLIRMRYYIGRLRKHTCNLQNNEYQGNKVYIYEPRAI